MRLITFWTGLLSCLLLPSIAVVGQDPFGDESTSDSQDADFGIGNSRGKASSANSAASPLPYDVFEKNAVVVALQKDPPQSTEGLARAVKLMARIQRWDEAARWLAALQSSGMDEQKAVVVTKEIGLGGVQSLLSPDAQISDNHRKFIQSIVDLSNKSRLNPSILSGHVASMRSADRQTRVQSFLEIQAAGDLGVAVLISDMMKEGAKPPTPIMGEAIAHLQTPAIKAWKTAISTPHEDAKRNLLLAAIYSKDLALIPELKAHLTTIPDTVEWKELKQLFSEIFGSTQLESVAQNAVKQLQSSFDKYQQLRWEDSPNIALHWELVPGGRGVQSVEGSTSDNVWNDVVVNAQNVLASQIDFGSGAALASGILIEDSIREHGDVNGLFPDEKWDHYEHVCSIWDAIESQDLANAQKFLTVKMARFSDPMPNSVRERLVRGLESGHRAVRYSSAMGLLDAIAIGRNRGENAGSFHGRSKMDRVVAEIAEMPSKPVAMIIGSSSSLRTHLSTLLREFDYLVTEQSNALGVMNALKKGSPVDAIFVVSNVTDAEMGQLLQRVRSTTAGSVAPIAVLADTLSRGTSDFLTHDKRSFLGYVPAESAGLSESILRINRISQTVPISVSDEIVWKDEAKGFRERELQKLVVTQKSTPKPILAGTPLSQKALVEIVINDASPLPEREQASQIFVQSVRQFGLLLSTETANAQYDVYNDRARTDLELRRMLGRVLDAIEASHGSKDWSSIAP